MKSIARWALPLLLISALATPGFAQDIKWKDNKEYEDYMGVYKQTDLAKKAAAAETFLVDHKDADPLALTQIYQMMLLSYANAGNWAKTLETVERQSMAPKLSEADKRQYTQIGLLAATNLKNNAKVVEYAEKVLAFDPNNLNALISLSNILSQTLPATEPGKTAALAKTLEITKRALAQPKPANIPDTQWNPIQLQLRQTASMVLLNQQKYAESMAEAKAALSINPKDGYAWYLIGMSLKVDLADRVGKYSKSVDNFNAARTTADPIQLDELKSIIQQMEQLASEKRTETLDAFAKSAAAGGPTAEQARQEIQKITQNPEETNKLIEEKKSQLGND
jgi:tetratricopeptide (TPR) repeat protein